MRNFLNNFTASKRVKAALPVFLAVAFCFLNLWRYFNELDWEPPNFGSYLLAGLSLPHDGITLWMPLFLTVTSLVLNLGINSAVFFVILHFGVYSLVFCAGCLLRGYWAGILSLVAAGLFEAGASFPYNAEQSFYSFFILLVLCLLLLRRRENTLKNSLLSGLAVGASLLVRTPLFLFPPAVVFCDRLYGGKHAKTFILRSLVFLAAAYVLLVPWGVLNYSISGKFSLDNRKAACNLITGGLGGIYTMEGDCYRLAGIGYKDSAFGFFVREAAKNPLFYARTVLRRLWHIFLFSPVLFGLFLIALFANRERGTVFSLPVYFIFIHSLLSIEMRYFYPMAYLLPPLIAGSLLPRRFDEFQEEQRGFAGKAVLALFWLSFCAVMAVEALVMAYPRRSARNNATPGAFSKAFERFPNDRIFQELRCQELLGRGDYAGYYKCLGEYSGRFDDKVSGYFISVIKSSAPAAIALPRNKQNKRMKCLIIRMLREFELGDRAAALVSLGQAYAEYETGANMLRKAPYKKDKELAFSINQDRDWFWDIYVYNIFPMWPPESRAKIFSELKKNIPLTARFRLMDFGTTKIPAGKPRPENRTGI